MISVNEKKKECCGCGACSQICHMGCITMCQDSEGFLYPVTDVEKCIRCNRCNQVCPIENAQKVCKESKELRQPLTYGAWHKDDTVRDNSSSGGAFTLFAEHIIAQGGVVYGCALDEDMKAFHIGVDDICELDKLRGSKYVQSKIEDTYVKVKSDILAGKKVLFVGTPCQAAGLYYFLGKRKHDNLYIADFICHGVPSPKVFEEYIGYLERKYDSKIVSFKFRNKDYGWSQTGLQLGTKVKFANGKFLRKYPAFKDSFMNGFLDDIYLRPSCYECQFKSLPKEYADFTIADFWGVDKVSKRLNDKKGTSLILVHSKQGENMWKLINDKCYFEKVSFESAIRRNKSLIQSAKINPKRNNFYYDFEERGYSYVERKYMSVFQWASHKILKMRKQLIQR